METAQELCGWMIHSLSDYKYNIAATVVVGLLVVFLLFILMSIDDHLRRINHQTARMQYNIACICSDYKSFRKHSEKSNELMETLAASIESFTNLLSQRVARSRNSE